MPGLKGSMDRVARLVSGARWLTREWPRPCAGVDERSMREPATPTGEVIDPKTQGRDEAQSS